ncbi:hypothetical protein [Mangrovihabitans endophyticus]|uniref:Uncharacterized protein n=1 Tax=Mangrovihabitans endophyticus TaxID=1751298 RepID=A0A8J3C8Y9_9ACTN|nr:hypothetical protein [Mangrovihabitans endophyticus]GGL19626.1 hypothetical protein GCM10012284_62760 [Mangrovihabitans endophyticus]
MKSRSVGLDPAKACIARFADVKHRRPSFGRHCGGPGKGSEADGEGAPYGSDTGTGFGTHDGNIFPVQMG